MTRYLDERYDPALVIDPDLIADKIVSEEIDRLQTVCGVVSTTLLLPRRLSEASPAELVLDKKRARRVLHVARKCLASWGGEEREATDEEKIKGAQLDWLLWFEDVLPKLERKVRYLATWGKKTQELKFAKSAVVKLEQEISWLRYAMRE